MSKSWADKKVGKLAVVVDVLPNNMAQILLGNTLWSARMDDGIYVGFVKNKSVRLLHLDLDKMVWVVEPEGFVRDMTESLEFVVASTPSKASFLKRFMGPK